MEEKSGGGSAGESAIVSPSITEVGGRQRFTIELRPGETTIVSWKKLAKDTSKVKSKGSASASKLLSKAHPALESRIAPGQPSENKEKDAPPASRFSAVIEKIERLYMGKHSSDEEDLNDVPDDDEYDTEDSFIDDTELDEYFQVDNSTIKHDGFFVNRGKLEPIIEPTQSPLVQPKKRRRKDLAKDNGENHDDHLPNKLLKVGKKTAGKPEPSVRKSSVSPAINRAASTGQCEDVKFQSQMNAPVICSKKNSTDGKASLDPSPSKISNVDHSLSLVEEKDIEKQKTGAVPSKNHGNKLKDGSEFSDESHQRPHEKSSNVQIKSESGKLLNTVDESEHLVQQKDKSGVHDRPDFDVSEGKHPITTAKFPPMHRKEGSTIRSKGSMLEKSIRELERMVAESRPPALDVPDADVSSQAVKRRLPHEVKQKLAKIARLATASHGKISKELINRLMSIVGHLVQLRTLKRNLKVMVNMGLSAKQEKDDKFQLIKKEVTEMIKSRVPSPKAQALEHQAGASDDFQEAGNEEKVVKRKCSMDDPLEDKICDIYDLYVEGLEEDAGPQVRKLYTELADLWPKGHMDNHGIKRAICRSKDRRRALHNRHKDQEKIKRRKLLAPKTEESVRVEASFIAQPQYVMPDKSIPTDLGNNNNNFKAVSNSNTLTTAARILGGTFVNGPTLVHRPKQEKLKGNSPNSGDTRDSFTKKKVKRRPETELSGGAHFRPDKSTSAAPGEERNKFHKQVLPPHPQKPNFQQAALTPPYFEKFN